MSDFLPLLWSLLSTAVLSPAAPEPEVAEIAWVVSGEFCEPETVGPEWFSDIDGIEFEADRTLQITPVGGPLIRYRSGHEAGILAGEGINSANHGYSASLNLALIPTGYDNTVIAIRVPVSIRPSSRQEPSHD